MTLGNSTSDSPPKIANMFNEFFGSVFEASDTALDTIDLNNISTYPEAPNIPSITITKSQIKSSILNLDLSKGAGPDGIGPIFLKNTAELISEPLYIIFNLSIQEGTFPDFWKLAYIKPLHKSRSKNNIPNYRPISILSIIPKLFESLIKESVYSQLKYNICQQQHGFMKARSTTTNLILYSSFLFNKMDKGIQVDAIYTDFQKAFDKVDHVLLLKRLRHNGITGRLLHWFKSYLHNRYQVVTINGHQSDKKLVSSGVVQGSILGPIQYLLFINDIANCFQHCKILMFADDLKIFKTITTQEDCIQIQIDLNRFNEFCASNKLMLAHDKCKQITFTRNKNKIQYTYNIGGHTLDKVSSMKDLGVLFDEKLTFEAHTENICTKAYQMLGFILRISKSFKQPKTLLMLYKTLVRSQLEYASVVWNPFYAVYSDKLESIQKKALKSIHYRLTHTKSSYDNLLELYKLQNCLVDVQ